MQRFKNCFPDRPAAEIPKMVIDSYRKAGPPRLTPHETNKVAPKNNWRVPESVEKLSLSPGHSSPLKLVPTGGKCSSRSTTTPFKHANLYRFIKRRMEDSIMGAHCKGNLVPSREQTAYRLPGTKGSFLGPKRVSRPMLELNSTHSYRQHHSGCLHKQ